MLLDPSTSGPTPLLDAAADAVSLLQPLPPAATSVPSSCFQIALLPILPGCLHLAEIPGLWVVKEAQLPGLLRALVPEILPCSFGQKL